MGANASQLRDTWLSFIRSTQPDALEELVEAYPDRRSLYVDVLDLHQGNPELAKALFSNPDRVLATASNAVADAHESLQRVNVRLKNHPGLLQVSSVRTRHVGELVTLEGKVAEIGPVGARVERAAYECGACGEMKRYPVTGLDLDTPDDCRACGTRASFDFNQGGSTYVDYQRITLREPADDVDDRSPPIRFDVYLDDDLVETVELGAHVLVTGVIRLRNVGDWNRFTFHLDANAVTNGQGGIAAVERETQELQDVIETRWHRVVDE